MNPLAFFLLHVIAFVITIVFSNVRRKADYSGNIISYTDSESLLEVDWMNERKEMLQWDASIVLRDYATSLPFPLAI